jgi:hypothetical protein
VAFPVLYVLPVLPEEVLLRSLLLLHGPQGQILLRFDFNLGCRHSLCGLQVS